MADARALVESIAARLDPTSRYVPELLAVMADANDLDDLQAQLAAGCRGLTHAGEAFGAMTWARSSGSCAACRAPKWA